MTRDIILAATGLHLRELVAEHVMGMKRLNKYTWEYPNAYGIHVLHEDYTPRSAPRRRFLPDVNVNHALEVAGVVSEKLDHLEFILVRFDDQRWIAGWFEGYFDAMTMIIDGRMDGGYETKHDVSVIHENPAVAICRSALLVVLDKEVG